MAIKQQNVRRIKNGALEQGTVGLFARFGKASKITSPEPEKVHWSQADRMINRYPGIVKFLSALKIKYFSGDLFLFV